MNANTTDIEAERVAEIAKRIDDVHGEVEALRGELANARQRGALRRVQMALDDARGELAEVED